MEDVQRIAQTPIPRFYRDEPTCGGEMKAEPEHFRVTEEPLYEASGDGDHLFVYVTKRDLDHESMLRTLVKRLDVARSEIGYAGTKDVALSRSNGFRCPVGPKISSTTLSIPR